jgi:hypothetical protein
MVFELDRFACGLHVNIQKNRADGSTDAVLSLSEKLHREHYTSSRTLYIIANIIHHREHYTSSRTLYIIANIIHHREHYTSSRTFKTAAMGSR